MRYFLLLILAGLLSVNSLEAKSKISSFDLSIGSFKAYGDSAEYFSNNLSLQLSSKITFGHYFLLEPYLRYYRSHFSYSETFTEIPDELGPIANKLPIGIPVTLGIDANVICLGISPKFSVTIADKLMLNAGPTLSVAHGFGIMKASSFIPGLTLTERKSGYLFSYGAEFQTIYYVTNNIGICGRISFDGIDLGVLGKEFGIVEDIKTSLVVYNFGVSYKF